MKIRLLVAVIVFGISMFCGLVIVTNGVLAGRFNSMYSYTAKDVCGDGEKLVLETDTNTTSGGVIVLDNNVYLDIGFTQNTLYCVNDTSGEKRDVTNETYSAFEKLKSRLGWWATIALFLLTMTLILIFEPAILKRVDKVIGYQPPSGI